MDEQTRQVAIAVCGVLNHGIASGKIGTLEDMDKWAKGAAGAMRSAMEVQPINASNEDLFYCLLGKIHFSKDMDQLKEVGEAIRVSKVALTQDEVDALKAAYVKHGEAIL